MEIDLDENEDIERMKVGSELNGIHNKYLETKSKNAKKKKSLYIIYFIFFLESFGLAFVMSGIWPYLSKLDPTATKGFYSVIVSANPFGQFISAPWFGYWTNKLKSIKIPMITSLIIFTVSNAMFSLLHLIPSGVEYCMLIIRFLTGVSGACVTVARSYISDATTVDERTHVLSMSSLAQVCGFILAPLLQAVLTVIGDGIVLPGGIHFNMYTAPGWINVTLGATVITLFLSRHFTEYKAVEKEQTLIESKRTEKKALKEVKVDYLVIWLLIFSYLIVAFNLVILESLSAPLSMDQFGFSNKEALKWNGIIIGIGAIVSCLIFVGLPRVSKIFKEIDILIWGGFFIAVLGKIIYIPYRSGPPKLAADREYLSPNGTISFYDDDHPEILGCPVKTQPWCANSSALGIPEFVIGYFLSIIAYPIGSTLIQSLFTKRLGPRPQGTWIGIMAGISAVSRIIGPIIVVRAYTAFGLGYTFTCIALFMSMPMIVMCILKNRLTNENIRNLDMESEKMNNEQKV